MIAFLVWFLFCYIEFVLKNIFVLNICVMPQRFPVKLICCFLFFISCSFFASAQSPCVDGLAGVYPCNRVDLMSYLSPQALLAESHQGVWLNDLWGWTDPETGKEYALVGMTNGTSFVDISDPVNPQVLGILPEHEAAQSEGARLGASAGIKHDEGKSVWRDIKVYENHAFVVSEDPGHGVQVFDLTRLRNVENPPAIFSETAHYSGIGKAHNIFINEETGFAYALGANSQVQECNEGGLHIIDVRDPANPVFAGCFDEDGYTHDTQCVIYAGPDERYTGMEICFSSNEDAVSLVNVSEKDNPQLISSETYTGFGYVHQGWLTEDHRFFLSGDELDELQYEHNARTYIWDVQDLENPVLIGTYTGPNPSIDHNLYIKGEFVYEANYTSGLQILSLLDVENGNLSQLAFFDTYPENDEPIFEGAWSNYPFFESGLVVVSDITGGLFVLKPRLSVILQDPEDFIACVSGEAVFEVVTSEEEGLSFQWQLDEGSGFTDLENNERYSQVNTRQLLISQVNEELDGNRYRLKITEADGTEIFSDDALLGVTDMLPEAEFEFRTEKGSLLFTNLSANASSYIWDFGDGNTSEAESPNHVFEEAGEFEVSLTAINGCGTDTQTQTVSFVTSVVEPEVDNTFDVYPNPVRDVLSIAASATGNQLRAIRLYNVDGRLVMQREIPRSNQDKVIRLDLSAYQKGLYFLQLQTPSTSISKRIVLE